MTTIGHYMERDHRACEGQYVLAESHVMHHDWAGALREFGQFRLQLERRMQREEQVLFPHLDRTSGNAASPTSLMRGEHGYLRAVLELMDAAIVAGSGNDFFTHADTLYLLMRQHNLKEENVVFPMADRLFDGQVTQLLALMDCIGREPPAEATAPP
ncbi:hemerythrin domain-containing protein [Oxalobacteraceae bacterium]|nr:hemerythrin domain-containing protein [Oxalobacteraceae bacterium]